MKFLKSEKITLEDYYKIKNERKIFSQKAYDLQKQVASLKREIKLKNRSKIMKIASLIALHAKNSLNWLFTSFSFGSRVCPKQESASVSINKIIPIKNKVCYILHNTLPYASGGYATRSHGVSKGLLGYGYNIIAVSRAGYPTDVKGTEIQSCDDSTIDGVQYRRICKPVIKGSSLKDYMHYSVEAYIHFFQLERPSAVIAASSYRHAYPAIKAAKQLGIATAYEVRGFWEITRVSREPSFINHSNYKTQVMMEAKTATLADCVFTLTNSMKNELIERGVDENKISITPNACNPDSFTPKPANNKLRKSLKIPVGIPVIGYIGSWVHYEGLEDLVMACIELYQEGVEFRCLLLGSENVATNDFGPIHKNILDLIEKSKVKDWIIMPGRVLFDQVPDYYSLIDIAPFPRKSLPVTELVSPMKPLEALAMKKAVLVSSVGGMSEMIEDGVTGVVFNKDDVPDLTLKLKDLISNQALRESLGERGREYVLSERKWNTSVSNIDFWLKKVNTSLS
jgi:glycosyltransferase involved in cell wall biosynthesis